MKFWDSSALVPLCIDQPRTKRARALYEEDPEIVVWWGSPIECASAFARLRRDGLLTAKEEEHARALLAELADAWYEVQPGEALRQQALRLLRLHPVRAAGSLQLAAALEWAGVPASGELVTFDERLRSTALLEGFRVP